MGLCLLTLAWHATTSLVRTFKLLSSSQPAVFKDSHNYDTLGDMISTKIPYFLSTTRQTTALVVLVIAM